jgi:ssDNA-binding Zn-finger/Zn-ribbon topoisomerase 1
MKSNVQLIVEVIETVNKTKESSGEVDCPKCGGKLIFTKSKMNGHVSGKCNSVGCLRFMM